MTLERELSEVRLQLESGRYPPQPAPAMGPEYQMYLDEFNRQANRIVVDGTPKGVMC